MSPWESKGPTKASDLQEGDRVDFKGDEPFLSESNKAIAERDYASIRLVQITGLEDGGEVTVYTHNFPHSIVLPADTLVHVERWH